MPPPSGFSDFYELELKINYNNAAAAYLQEFSSGGLTPPQERQAGWTERYILNSAIASTPPYQAAYNLTAARCGVLAFNFYVKHAIIHQASVFKSSFPLPNFASLPPFDNLAANATDTQSCSSPEETLLLRQEAANLRRWEYQIRGVKDYMSDDAMTYFAAPSYYGGNSPPNTSVFDTLASSPVPPGSNGGTPATITVTLSNGVPSYASTSAAGSFPGVQAGAYYGYMYPANGIGTPALCVVTIGGGASVTSLAVSTFSTAQGWTGTSGTVYVGNDPNGLPNWQTPGWYWANLMSNLINYTSSGTTRRIAQNRFSAPVPSFPSNLAPVIVGSLANCTRSLFQRVGNRQTGQIRLTKPARRKIAR